jgi:HSP20 family protein
MASRDRRDMSALNRRAAGSSSTPARESYGSSPNYGLDPFSQFRRFADQMDRWFDTVGIGRTNNRMAGGSENAPGVNLWAPEMETFLRDDQFVIRLDLPGVSKEQVNVEVTDESVIIHGERQQLHEEDRDGYYRSERSYGRFYREVQLPDGAQPESAKANYRDGVLEVSVTAPARQVTRPRRIDIGSSTTTERQERDSMVASSASSASSAPSASSASSTSTPITDRTTAASQRRGIAHDREPRMLDTE